MSKVKISVIVPIYNSEKYLERCIESLINQTLQDIEIILVNDGSLDNSYNIIKYYQDLDSRVSVINQKNQGVSIARNEGIKRATGEYITFVDSDDWCDKNMFKDMYNASKCGDIDLVVIGYSLDNDNNKSIKVIKVEERLYSDNLNNTAVILSKIELGYSVMKLYKRENIINNDILFNHELSFGEDAIFVQDYLMTIKSIVVLDIVAYHYVKCNDKSLSSKYVDNMDIFIECYWCKYEKLINKFPFLGEAMKETGHIKEISATILSIYNMYRSDCEFKRKQRIANIREYMINEKIKSAINQYKPMKKSHKIFKILYKTKNPYFMDFIYSFKKLV